MGTKAKGASGMSRGRLMAALGTMVAAVLLMAPCRAAAQATPRAGATPAAKAAPAKQAPARPVAKAKDKPKERVISIDMAKGETYTIDGVAENGGPGIKVMANPNALVVRTDAPGRIVLVGADAGTWRLNVTLASGEKVIYEVNVTAIAQSQGSLEPGAAPTVMH